MSTLQLGGKRPSIGETARPKRKGGDAAGTSAYHTGVGFDFLLLIAGLVALGTGWQRLRRLEDQVADLRRQVARIGDPALTDFSQFGRTGDVAQAPPPVVAPEPAPGIAALVADRRTARVVHRDSPPPPPATPATEADPQPSPEPRRAPGFESLVGAKLPIWVGGAALVVAGFFLVRLSIESGLFGPVARVVTAALFSAALVAGGEVARRLPSLRADPRVGQVLSGAGIASAYGTLYVAAAQYHLIGAAAAFAVMVAITAAALALSLRHGPPTAIMALIGGFSAPLLAGSDAPELGLLLAYLAVFIAALFALARHRGWRWLAIAALVAGFGWANLLIVLFAGRDVAGVGAFVVALAVAGTLTFPHAAEGRPWLRAAPLVAGLVQLIVLAPSLDFGPVAWIFHLVLVAAALVLARRDASLMPAAVAAACLFPVLVAAGLIAPERVATPVAAVIGTALLGGAGLAFARRSSLWAVVALAGLAGPVLVSHAAASTLLSRIGWTLAELALAAGAAWLAWSHRDAAGTRSVALVGGTAIAGILAGVGLASLVGEGWAPLALVAVLLALGGWANRVEDADLARLPAVAWAVMLTLAVRPIAAGASLVATSVTGGTLPYLWLPPLADVGRMILLPAIAAAALFALPRAYGTLRPRVAAVLAVVGIGVVYFLAKQPLAIGDDARFLVYGFVERAGITALFAATGWALATRNRFRRTGTALLALALARFVWFDLLLMNPVTMPQNVGALPVLNAAVLLPLGLAAACWTVGGDRRWRAGGVALALLAALATVRQIAHGTDLTGPLGRGENWGYSAILLALSILWLWRGVASHSRPLRIAALVLLTAVTLKVFLIDVAALGGVLRILSLLGLGIALIGIGWTYNRIIAHPHPNP